MIAGDNMCVRALIKLLIKYDKKGGSEVNFGWFLEVKTPVNTGSIIANSSSANNTSDVLKLVTGSTLDAMYEKMRVNYHKTPVLPQLWASKQGDNND